MARKKKSQQADQTPATGSSTPSPAGTPKLVPAASTGADAQPTTSSSSQSSAKKAAGSSSTVSAASTPSTSALIICRNKHWRYISSFHGPWLQLPPEVLESLAHTNYLSPRPQPIDPAVFYDLVKIRKAVDEATNLAVRATSGLTSQALSNSLNAGNGMLGNAAALGIGYGGGGGGGNAKLSRERKHRMRELATAKLSQAYHLDEIAASVATMQSASTLEDVAHLVLQRNPGDVDAKYVHFFHEKIPSRMMAECTPLTVLDDIISERPSDGSPLRTRALTRIFKGDYINSAKDLSEGLAIARYMQSQHRAGKDQLVLAKSAQEQYGRDWRQEVKIPEEDQPSSLETQLLFHRAGVYFTIACQWVHTALDGLKEADEAKARREAQIAAREEPTPETLAENEANCIRTEARKQVRTNAKRALRDYTAFLSHFDYTPGISAEATEALIRELGNATNGTSKDSNKPVNRLVDSSLNPSSPVSEALVPHRRPNASHSDRRSWPKFPTPEIFKVSQLFEPAPPASLPPYPPPPGTRSAPSFPDSHETITYHPLLTDALHSLLLCHALVQTPPKELLRHAHNAARLARICDGYPIFLAARSPARADWIEVLRRAGNWIGIMSSWETLCRPAPLPGHGNNSKSSHNGNGTDVMHAGGASSHSGPRPESEAQKRERQKHEAILEALADERVVDEDSFQRAVRARERRFREDDEMDARAAKAAAASASASGYGSPPSTANTNGTSNPTTDSSNLPKSTPKSPPTAPKRWAQDDGREYPISTERAEAISRWVRDAPRVVEGTGAKRRKGRKGGVRKISTNAALARGTSGLEESVETLSLGSEGVGEDVE